MELYINNSLIKKVFIVPFLIILTSLYLFPFFCSYLPTINTKMLMAACSLGLLLVTVAMKRSASVDDNLFTASIYAGVVSLVGLAAVIINGATDYTYASYIMSMWVWLGGAYVVVSAIKALHGRCTVLHVCNYFIAVCVAQCTIAMMVDSLPAVKTWVDGFVVGEGFMGTNEDRLYGIGASLDVAGMRFAAILIMIAVILQKIQNTDWQKYQTFYILAFLYIFVVGSMIGRTTGVGAILALAYWVKMNAGNLNFKSNAFKISALIIVLGVVACIYLYNTSPSFYKNVRFGFEGVFSLIETGHWETNSNNRLVNMVVWPDNIKTWIIGDGYFNNPLSSNEYYIGGGIGTFYMNTDIGYCRFIFYFGVIGLAAFIAYFLNVCKICCNLHNNYKPLFILIVIANFIIWGKVASDLFVLFAPFLLITEEGDEYNVSTTSSNGKD